MAEVEVRTRTERDVELTLTEEEAQVLCRLLRYHVGGESRERDTITSISSALNIPVLNGYPPLDVESKSHALVDWLCINGTE